MKIAGRVFYFVRHAPTLWNEKKLCQGAADIALSKSGERASKNFAKQLTNFSLKGICSSPLSRARCTAEMICEYHPNATLTIIDELRERNWGSLEGISSAEMYAIEEKEERDPSFLPGQGIENRKDLKHRVMKGLNKSFEIDPQPLIVSHGRVFLSLCELLELEKVRQVPNLALIQFKYDGSKWSSNQLI